ncbi:NAD(P)-binding domain-containing protein, partial [Streptomyces sp. SID10244]|nr:NAD(P)-binding domain-containing protein [Streptomyces sp. SID10244]
MATEKISRVGVIGAGQMGAGIAEVCARAHADVLVYESTRELAAAGRARILRSLDRGVSSG